MGVLLGTGRCDIAKTPTLSKRFTVGTLYFALARERVDEWFYTPRKDSVDSLFLRILFWFYTIHYSVARLHQHTTK
jgi:hypothetical protein